MLGKGGSLLGAVLAGLVLGAFVMATLVVLVINAKATPLEPEPIYKPVKDYRIGGDA
jgi:hypothetical protein